jgi:homoserine kinase type II
MAVKTEFSSDDLRGILANYDLGDYQDATAFSDGAVQTNLLVQTTKGKFALRYYEERSKEAILFEVHLIDYLTKHQYPCPAILSNKQGALLSHFNGRPVVFFEYVEGRHIEHLNADQKRQIIQQAAELQRITQDYQPVHAGSRLNYTPEGCFNRAKEEADKLNTANAWAKLVWLETELSNLQLPQTLPRGICHSDYHHTNILFRDGEFVALLDFDDANYTYSTFDLVNLIDYWAWPHDGTFMPDAAREIAETYNQHRSLSDVEKLHLFDVHKIQIFFDSIWFMGRGDVSDFYEKSKIDYLDDIGRERYCRLLFGE